MGLETCTRNSLTLGFQKKCCSNCEAIKRFLNEKFLCECSAPVVPGQRCDMDPGFLDAGERVLTRSNFYRDNECVFDAAEQDLGWS